MPPSTIGGINHLPEEEKRKIYSRVIPPKLLDHFNLPTADSIRLQSFLKFDYEPGSTDVEMSLFHEQRFPDPVLYGHLTDTMNGQIHILLYILNDPNSPRFDVDRMPDGRKTSFGTRMRNLEAERAALEAGLAPGQVRSGLRMLSSAIASFEKPLSAMRPIVSARSRRESKETSRKASTSSDEIRYDSIQRNHASRKLELAGSDGSGN